MRTCWSEEPSGRPRFNQILDVVDDVAEQLSLRPQLARSSVPSPLLLAEPAPGARAGESAPSPPGVRRISSDGSGDGTLLSSDGSGAGRTPARQVAIALIDYVSQNKVGSLAPAQPQPAP